MSCPTVPARTDEPFFEVRFDAPEPGLVAQGNGCYVNLPVPLLSGPTCSTFSLKDAVVVQEGGLLMLMTEHLMMGAVLASPGVRLEEPVQQAYAQLLRICVKHEMHLHRVWNYVPHINEQVKGLERYQQFNIGRWMAFEEVFGRDLRSFMPAASAVGIAGDQAIMFFVAGKTHPLYLENPSQIPAYHYPKEYGPRPPSFARAVLIHEAKETAGYLSGTASIEGHKTVGEGDWHTQFRVTMHNIQIMLERMDMLSALRNRTTSSVKDVEIVDFRCYLRHEEMLPLVKEWLAEEAPMLAERTIYQKADICRHDLDLEMEGIFWKAK